MATMTSLPRFFVIRAMPWTPCLCPPNLTVVPQKITPESLLKLDEPQIFSPRVKFATEKSKTGDDTLVHIRSCFNNKYWVASREVGVAAIADEPNEDTTKSECTLFQISITSMGHFNFKSIGCYSVAGYTNETGGALVLNVGVEPVGANFTVVDWEKLVILPSQLTFKSEEDGRYLGAWYNDHAYNKFMSGLEIGDPRVAYEPFPMTDGNYRIKSRHFGKFWRRSPNWIWADAEENDDPNTMFECIKVKDNVIALRNLGNNAFCGGLTTEGKTDCLNAWYSSITKETRLIVEERVMRREISNVEYRLPASRVYEKQLIALAEQNIENKSPNKDLEQVITFSENTETSTSWKSSMSVKFGVSISFKVEAIPLIAGGEVELSSELGYEHEWGETKTTGIKIETSTKVVVPPLTNMKVSFLCTKGSCDVPFSYTQTDLLHDGQTVTTVKDDGVYNAVNAYGFKIRSAEVDEHGQELKVVKDEPASVTSKFDEVIPRKMIKGPEESLGVCVLRGLYIACCCWVE